MSRELMLTWAGVDGKAPSMGSECQIDLGYLEDNVCRESEGCGCGIGSYL